MGPRSHERGNSVVSSSPRHPPGLQWGRVLMNAETLSIHDSMSSGFASMGPRSHERGNEDWSYCRHYAGE